MENWTKLVKNNETWNMKPQPHLFIPSSNLQPLLSIKQQIHYKNPNIVHLFYQQTRLKKSKLFTLASQMKKKNK